MSTALPQEDLAPADISDLSFKKRAPIAEAPQWKLRDKTIVQNVSDSLSSVADFWGPVVAVDFILGVSLLWVSYAVAPGVPGGVITAAVIIVIGLRRKARLRQTQAGLWLAIVLAFFAFLVWTSWINGMPYTQRLAKFALFAAMGYVISTGRVDVRSLVLGGVAGALLNVPLFYGGLAPNDYPPYLTGFYTDKNISGMYYALWGVLGFMILRRRWTKVVWLVAGTGLLFLTGSRTAMFGFILALVWIVIRNRLNLFWRLIAVILGVVAAGPIESRFAQNSLYGDRSGTDWFRAQIEAAMTEKADRTPWYGLGLNQGQVTLQGGRTIWFHNSYLQSFVEGGWVFVAFIVAAFVVAGFGLFQTRRVPHQLAIAQAGLVVVMACAWKLGEVFMTAGAFTVLGICFAFTFGQRIEGAAVSAGAASAGRGHAPRAA